MTYTNKVDFEQIEEYIERVGAFIAEIIKRKGVSKKAVSVAVDMSTNTVNNCCRGKNPNIKTLLSIGASVGLSPVEIFAMMEGIEIAEEEVEEVVMEDDCADVEHPMAGTPEETFTQHIIKDESSLETEKPESVELEEESIQAAGLIPDIFE